MRRSFILVSVLLVCGLAVAQQRLATFDPSATFDSSLPAPDSALGYPLGSRPARYGEVLTYFRRLAAMSPRARFVELGTTYEGRSLFGLIVSSDEHMKRLDEIRAMHRAVALPGKGTQVSPAELDRLPLIVWIGYSIHGDELSSVDASVGVAHRIVAGTDSLARRIRQNVVTILIPMQNPDGRERFLAQMEQWRGPLINTDAQSMHHTGMWPYGRGNHYLFDLNRDWILQEHPETRGMTKGLTTWMPQVIIDSHEMGAYDTYLFSPPRDPINPNVSPNTLKWWKVFSADQARAFDAHGWSYYTREWSDEWYPGYGNSWALYVDAIGILYEQAGVEGSAVKRPDGATLDYRTTVHHHYVSSLANLSTAAERKSEIQRDYAAMRREGVTLGKNDPRTYYITPGNNSSRAASLARSLAVQGIEVNIAAKSFSVTDARDPVRGGVSVKQFPAGTYIISLRQPQGRLAKALLEFDPRMTNAFLQEERKSLEKNRETKLYDITAWSLSLSYGAECYASVSVPLVQSERLADTAPIEHGSFLSSKPAYGYIVAYGDDAAPFAALKLLEKGYKLRSANEIVTVGGKRFDRGAILIRNEDNPSTLGEDLERIANETGVDVTPVNTALSESGPDLGGNDFALLKEPRIALAAGPEVSSSAFGALWHLFDRKLRIRMSVLTIGSFNWFDLAKYNVLILPPGSYTKTFGKEGIEKLRKWTEAGGTLIGIGSGASFLADTATGLSAVRLKHQALRQLEQFKIALELERKGGQPVIDSLQLWEAKSKPDNPAVPEKFPTPDEQALKLRDERARLFSPRGALLAADCDTEHWLTFGMPDRVPVMSLTSFALLSKHPVQTPVRYATEERLRLSGLLWQEAKEYWANSSYATREKMGDGQIVLFASEPNFRGGFRSTERLLINGVLFGPGFGTTHRAEW